MIEQYSSEELIREIIKRIGDDPNRSGIEDTPSRVVKSWQETYAGYSMDYKKILGTTFEKGTYDQIIICKNIEFYSVCEHHLLPFYGQAHIGYIPGEKVVGLSKLARVVDVFARRMQIQEKMTEQIKNAIVEVLEPVGVMVIVEGKHHCMCSRGVGKQNSSMVTSSIYGRFLEKEAREEFLNLVGS